MPFVAGKYQGARDLALEHVGQASTPTRVAIHYTVTDTLASAVSALNNRGLSYHFLIEPDGTVHQTRRPDRHAAHAGRSNWKAESGIDNVASVNRAAVSISFINRGFFEKKSPTHAFDTDAHGNLIGKSYPVSEVVTTASIYDPGGSRHWHRYTDAQLAASRDLIRDLRDEFDLTELVGHDDVSIDGKSDPGPLFPMQALRDEFGLSGGLGMRVTVQSPDGTLTLRHRPTRGSTGLATLHNGDEVHIRAVVYTYRSANALFVDRPEQRYLTAWASVDTDASNTHAGFVHMGFLSDSPLTPAMKARL